MERIVAIVGMCGAGKSVVADHLVQRGFCFLRFGQLTMDELLRRGLVVNEANERTVREELRKEYGMAAFALLNIPNIDRLGEHALVAIDGLYSWSEYKVLKERYGKRLVVLAVYASPATRYARLCLRSQDSTDAAARNRTLTPEQAASRDAAEIEKLEKGGPVSMADFLINNEGTLDDLEQNVTAFLEWLEAN